MSNKLLIVFVKNIKMGKVKTRLAKTIGDASAFEIYKALVEITEKATTNLNIDKRIYFSDVIIKTKWKGTPKFVQNGEDLGERMNNAFIDSFKDGYEHVVLIGTDLPTISEKIILKSFDELNTSEIVFGPAEDGGYYLVGMSTLNSFIFQNKSWSTSKLLSETLNEIQQNKIEVSMLETLNDIDTFEDLQQFPELLNRTL